MIQETDNIVSVVYSYLLGEVMKESSRPMKLRKNFLNYVTKRTHLTPEQIQKEAFAFEMDRGEPEERLRGTVEALEGFLSFTKEVHSQLRSAPRGSKEADSHWQNLYASLPQKSGNSSVDPGDSASVVKGLRADASARLNFRVREVGAKEAQDGMFWAPLHQQAVEIDDFGAQSPAQTRAKAMLFIDTTPGEDGGNAFIAPLVDIQPALEESEKLSDPTSVVADPTQVRSQVSSRLASVLTATESVREQALDRTSNDEFYTFYQDGKESVVLRIGAEAPGGPFATVVPGITKVEGLGVVSLAANADQKYGEHIELNGEERKVLLATLADARRRVPEPESESGKLSTQKAIHWQHRENLQEATKILSALVTNGDLGFYERAVTEMDLSESWLSRLRRGEIPSRAF